MKALGIIFIFILSACGGEDKKTKANPDLENQDSPLKITSEMLVGTWTSGCVLDPKLEGVSITRDLQFDTDKVNRVTVYFAGEGCTTLLYQENLESTYDFSENGAYSEKRKKVSIEPLSSASLMMFNAAEGFCQKTDWTASEEQTIADVHSCDIDPSVKMRLRIRKENAYKMIVKECEKRNPRDCKELEFTRF